MAATAGQGRRRRTREGAEGRAEKVGEALGMLEAGVGRILDGEEFRRYLRTAARFHRYSARNAMLILVQRSDASRVAGYRKWREMGRQVRKGEKGIKILAPISRAVEDEASEGVPGEKVRALVGFKTATVFDVAQTDGDELPEPPRPENLDPEECAGAAAALYEGLCRACAGEGVAVEDEDLAPGHYGSYDRRARRIRLSSTLSAVDRATTLAHELAHHLLHGEDRTTKAAGEIEAEGVSYAVCSYYGIGTGRFSFAYVARYAQEPGKLTEALERVQKATQRIIEALEEGEGE